jgi:hypothetical protein
MSTSQLLLAAAAAITWISLGGGAYEYLVVDPAWPDRPDLIQPQRGGVSRKRFWIPTHGLFEFLLLASLIACWDQPAVRTALLVAAASHATLRIWSFLDFIPKALAFERAEPSSISRDAAVRWSRRSLGRLPFAMLTALAMGAALIGSLRTN